MRRASLRASLTVRGARPSPGPSTKASARPARSITGSNAAGVNAPSLSGSGTDIASSRRTSNTRFSEAGTSVVTYPAPARIADSAAIDGAPVSPVEPPQTKTDPAANFVESWARWGTASSTAASISPTDGRTGAPSGMPMSITTVSPAWVLPGEIHSPGLAAWKVTVTWAWTALPATSPVDASTPLGTSQANTSAGPAAALMAAIAARAASRGSPSKPVPRMASTTPAAPRSAASSNGRAAGSGRRSRLACASPRSSSASDRSSTSTSRPDSRSNRATTSPSPPLLPLPTTTTTRPSGRRSRMTSAIPAPARSISSIDGI